MNLGRSFFSLYFLIVACFGALSWLLDEFWSMNVQQDVESYTGYKTVLIALSDRLVSFPVADWQGRVESANKRYDLPIQIVSDDSIEKLLPDLQYVKDERVTVYYDDNYITLFHPIANQNKVLILGPVQSPTRPRDAALIRVISVLLLGVVIFFWVWPISKDLDKLAKSAKDFGYGDFKIKVDRADSVLVQPMMNTFNMMASRINNLIEAHKELTNAVSHELRTPLARSKFALQVLRGAKDDETREKYIDKITTDVEELESLVNELLVYAAFESEQPNINFTNSDVKQLVDFQVASFASNDFDINFICEQDCVMAEYDAHFINRAFSNLLTNAVKYGQGKLQVSLLSDGQQCSLIVEDNGPGIDDDFKEIIFDAFSRYDKSRGKDTGGFGLGLAIVSKVMLWHNGSATVENSDLGGAKFILSWPVDHITG
ncbi:ATP-binding protein [Thalassotalea psychrophila]|uniref:histidine kinase n=1 Tax=Thalassotalea psychrophila TaxID=3065647 RepID=A0ABY9TYX3_9GAMM|nr:ATP-binding protein [Colwelliaceae bacterium SQ149]